MITNFTRWTLTCLMILIVSQLQATEPAYVHFDLDGCTSYLSDQSFSDFSEFTADISNTDEIELSVVNGSLYRNNPAINTHSCTPSFNGSEAMCVGYDDSCEYNPGTDKAIRFDVLVTPKNSTPVTVANLKFYEVAPLNFDWIDGASGINNYPTFIAIRVLVDGEVIYEGSDIPTTNEWTLRNINFAALEAFTVTEPTTFNFELSAYCPSGVDAMVSVWDIDEVKVTATCQEDPCFVDGEFAHVKGGFLSGGPFSFCVDGVADNIEEGAITVDGASGPKSQWVVTDLDGNILGLPPTFSAPNFDAAGPGTCLVWHISYAGQIGGLGAAGANINALTGCFEISNPIEVQRNSPSGGTLTGGPFEFTVGDGEADMIPEGSITVANSNGANAQWIVTDDEGNILGLPPMPSVVNFDGAGAGNCLIWYARYDGEISGLEVGQNANDIEGCFSLSNAIEVVRTNADDCQANGGSIFGGPFEFTVGDGEADMIPEGSITVANSNGANSQWIITDDEGNILGLPPTFTAPNFDGAGAGTCLVWYARYDGEISGLEVGLNANDIEGCFSLSNAIEVVRTNADDCQANGGSIFGGPFEFTVGDGVADMIPEGSITVANSNGANVQWIVTDDEGNILGLPPMPSVVNFDGAGAGNCLIWYLRYDGEIGGLAPGLNANDLEGCFGLSNPIEVVRTNADDCQANGGSIFGGPFEFTVGDGEADMIPEGSITVTNSNGANAQWIVTDDEGNILGLPPMPSVVNFDGAGAGNCLIWYARYDGEISGLAVGQNANDIEGCFSLSNAIEVVRTNADDCQANGGTIFGGPFEFTVGNGEADMIPEGSITVANSNGMNAQWIVTDDEGNILGLPPMPSVVNFDGAGAGNCLIWYARYDGEISGLEVGQNANDIEGCFSLSNAIEVLRTNADDCQANGGSIFGGPFEFTVGDGEADMIPEGSITVANSNGANAQWIVTDDEGNILGLPPMPSVVNFDGAGAGNCLIWYARYDGEISGLEVGQNANDIEGCFSLSNAIEVVRTNADDCQANGGSIFGGPFEFTVGDGEADMIPEGSITVANSNGANAQWIVTDDEGNILGLPPMPSVVNFDGAGAGNCLIWYLRYDGEIGGLAPGLNANDLEGCFGLSNPIEVVRTNADDCQANGGSIFGGPFEFTVGDGEADMIPEGSITVANSNGANAQWIVTDDEGNILGLPPMPSVVNFDGAGAGNCLIWYARYDGEISGLEVGQNANDIEGCFSLSNAIEVVRTNADDCQANGGSIFGGPFEFTVGDGEADMIPEGSITVANSNGANAQWIVTDDEGNILGLPPMPSVVNFDGAGAGNCLIWYLRYDGEIGGLAPGLNANDLEGCFGLSNPIEVVRTNADDCQANGGSIFGGPFEFTVGDGEADMIPEGSITVTNSNGANAQWIVTDDEGNILGLPPMPSVVNFDGAGAGNCLIWYARYDGEISGLEVGQNANDIEGCFSLSNAIEVVRTNADDCQANGGTIFGGPFEFTVGDGEADMIPEGSITVANSNGMNAQWIVTDDEGNILGLPPMPSVVNFDGAGAGNCLIWYARYDGEISGLEVGQNANDIEGCFSLSNAIEVVRTNADDCQANGGTIFGGPFEFTVGDGEADMIPEGSITVANSNGANAQWIVTDDEGNILGLPPMPSVVNFDGAGAGNCLIWYARYDGEISGLEVGQNANDIEGCFSLSNAIEVVRTNADDCQANGGTIFGGPFEFTVGDGEADMIPEGSITVANSNGMNAQWIVTDDEGNILGLPPMPSVVNFDGAGAGNCLIWYARYDGEISGLEVGQNANDIEGCFSLSNAIEVVRTNADDCQANGGTIFGGPFEFTVGDGEADMIPEGSITVANSNGANAQWIVTDDEGNILGLPPMPSVVNFDGAGAGNCLIWYARYDGEISGLEVGQNANDIEGCFSLSNAIEVVRTNADDCQANGGTIFGGPFEFTVGDGEADMIPEGSITVANSNGANAQWIITDDEGNILGLPPTFTAPNFDGAGAGTCLVWYARYDGEISGLEVGLNANDIEGCFSLSNAIEVVRTNADDCQANGGSIFGGPFEFTVGDGVADMIPEGAITVANSNGANSQWIITDDEGNILGLPPMPSVVNFDGAGAGNCLIWYARYDGEISGLEVGQNANNIEGCFSLSNAIEVVRTNADDCQANGGTIFGGPFEFTVGDGEADMIPEGAITVANSNGDNFQWIVTDEEGNILGLPPMPSVVDFDGAGVGTCLVWYLRYDGEISGLEMDANANDLEGCFDLSNPIEVVRTASQSSADGATGVVINQFDANGNVELRNYGTETVNISTYILCNFPGYDILSSLDIICGDDLMLEAGESVTVRTRFAIDPSDGELGLYINSNYSNPSSIVDYLEFGQGGHRRSGTAEDAGIWTTGDFIPTFDSANSISYDGSGEASTDYAEGESTICGESGSAREQLRELDFNINPTTAISEITVASDNDLVTGAIINIYNQNGLLVKRVKGINASDFGVNAKVDISDLRGGLYFLQMINENGIRTTKRFMKVGR